jgi:hypothetical protein
MVVLLLLLLLLLMALLLRRVIIAIQRGLPLLVLAVAAAVHLSLLIVLL